LAVESAISVSFFTVPAGRLKPLAVFAFWAEITRLSNHCSLRLAPENATAQTIPSSFTMVAHILLLSPPFKLPTALRSAVFKSAWLGSPLHALPVAETVSETSVSMRPAPSAADAMRVVFETFDIGDSS